MVVDPPEVPSRLLGRSDSAAVESKRPGHRRRPGQAVSRETPPREVRSLPGPAIGRTGAEPALPRGRSRVRRPAVVRRWFHVKPATGVAGWLVHRGADGPAGRPLGWGEWAGRRRSAAGSARVVSVARAGAAAATLTSPRDVEGPAKATSGCGGEGVEGGGAGGPVKAPIGDMGLHRRPGCWPGRPPTTVGPGRTQDGAPPSGVKPTAGAWLAAGRDVPPPGRWGGRAVAAARERGHAVGRRAPASVADVRKAVASRCRSAARSLRREAATTRQPLGRRPRLSTAVFHRASSFHVKQRRKSLAELWMTRCGGDLGGLWTTRWTTVGGRVGADRRAGRRR